jgi:glutaredoxin 2
MEYFKNMDLSPGKLLKILGVTILGLFVITVVFQLIGSFFGGFRGQIGQYMPSGNGMSIGGGGMMKVASYDSSSYGESYPGDVGYGAPTVSTRNALQILPPQQGSVGNDAENFEVTNYNASIETRKLDDTCKKVSALKQLDYVIFENSTNSDNSCNFTFKVVHEKSASVLDTIKGLNPKQLTENTYTIKQQVEDYTNGIEVLKKKRDSIDETLKTALSAYNEITQLATRTQNADALAQIINSKVAIIEKLTQEKININTQLDNLTRAKNIELDKLVYTYFSVNIYENKFVDLKSIYDSWKNSIRDFVWQTNRIIQELTINLVLFFLMIFQWLLYIVVLLVVAKHGWRFAKGYWNKE